MADHYEDYTREQLVRLLRERDKRPRFGLVWERDEIAHDLSVNSDFVALDWDAKLSCGDGPQDNLIIEGDNFDALRYLRMTHAGRIKCIYIDPPYNTGNRDFIYNDRFVDKEDGYRHSKWLEFMYRRLELAKELLTEDGIIFVSIGEDEFCRLTLLMDQVFVGLKRVGSLIWKTRHSADSRNQTGCSIDHEYILCYGQRIRGTAIDESKFENPDLDFRGPWRSADMTGLANKALRPNLHYELRNPETDDMYACPPKGWRYEPKSMGKLIKEKRVLWPAHASGRPRLKKFLQELKTKHKGFSSLLEAPLTSTGTIELATMDLSHAFSFPKPSGLIELLIEQATQPGDIVLDFFAGSGTTAQAVLNLNREDGGNRRFILVSSTEATPEEPDKNLCRDVCAERVRRVMTGYTDKKGQPVEGLGGGFAYLRCRRIPAATVFRGIQHGQIWTALQLIHKVALEPYQTALPLQVADTSQGLVIYLPKVSEAVLEALLFAVGSTAQAVVYSWQPALLAQRLMDPRVAFEPIPAFLVQRFGGRAGAPGGRA
jgi:adenine-specific DNA-methyltransferase